jgi:uncharacterized protein
VVGHGSILATKEQFETLIPFVGPAMLTGPSVAGILLTGLLYGKAGFRDLLTWLIRWRVGARWYAVALLTAPLLPMAITPCALAEVPRVPPPHIHTRRESCPCADGYRWGA